MQARPSGAHTLGVMDATPTSNPTADPIADRPTRVIWHLAHSRQLVLDRPRLLAIINTTPDSFYPASRVTGPESAVAAAHAAVADGADMLDLGGESTRPGAARIPDDEQIRRVVPAIEAIRASAGAVGSIPISIDTTRSAVARAALRAGADAINDVSAGRDDEDLLALAASARCGLMLMHRLVPPDRDAYSDRHAREPDYGSGGVVDRVEQFLVERAQRALASGVLAEAIVLDPGLGFGKSVDQNLDLIAHGPGLARVGYPVLSAASRKSFVGRVGHGGESSPDDRLGGSIAASLAHLDAGAMLFRVHDVAEQARALRVAWAIKHRHHA